MVTLDLKALKAKWYRKLEDSGFEDIEDTSSPKEMLRCWHSYYFQIRFTPHAFQEIRTYYQVANEFYKVHKFKNKLERAIWRYHTDGLSAREISSIVKTSPDKTEDVINKLVGLMRIGF